MFTQVTPPHRWGEDEAFHYLRLTLLGFEDKDIVINLDKYGHLVVRGDKQVKENEYITFEETFEVPKDGDTPEASGMFENNQIYCISIPKKGQGVQRAISIPKPGKKPVPDNNPRALDNNPRSSSKRTPSIRKHHSSIQALPQQGSNIVHNPLQVVRGDKSKRKFVFFMAIVIALLIIAVVLIVKLRNHG